MADIQQTKIRPLVPKVLEGERVFVYVPKASTTQAGIAQFDKDDFTVDSASKVKIKWPYAHNGVYGLVKIKANSYLGFDDNNELEVKQDVLDQEINQLSQGLIDKHNVSVAAHKDIRDLANNAAGDAADAKADAAEALEAANTAKTTAQDALNKLGSKVDKQSIMMGGVTGNIVGNITNENGSIEISSKYQYNAGGASTIKVGAGATRIMSTDPRTGTSTELAVITGQATIDGKKIATEEYVQENGGKIDSISVNGVEQQIVDKNVDISVPEVVNGLDSDSTTKALSAKQGKVLREQIANKQFGTSFDTIQAMVTSLNSAAADTYQEAFNFYIVQTNVPDFWVTQVEQTSVEYTYTTDGALINAVKVAPVQIGYYKISLLETSKVDLTNYYTKTETKEEIAKSDISSLKALDGTIGDATVTYDTTDGMTIHSTAQVKYGDNKTVNIDNITEIPLVPEVVGDDDVGFIVIDANPDGKHARITLSGYEMADGNTIASDVLASTEMYGSTLLQIISCIGMVNNVEGTPYYKTVMPALQFIKAMRIREDL